MRNLQQISNDVTFLAQVDDGVVFLAACFTWLLAIAIVIGVTAGVWHLLIQPAARLLAQRRHRREVQMPRRLRTSFRPGSRPPGIQDAVRRLI